MLVCSDDPGALLIGQPSHAWISGQLARAWGSRMFGEVEPFEEVCLGAEQHDIGMAEWDLSPARNPASGFPLSFMEMPIAIHLELWTAGPRRLLRQSRYAALLASMHGTRLYELRDRDRMNPDDAGAVLEFLHRQRQFQRRLLDSLRGRPGATPARVSRNSQLIWTWDFISLALCLGWAPCTVSDVPTAGNPVELRLHPAAAADHVTVDPWPFRDPAVSVRCEAQRLSGPSDSDEDLAEALAQAPWELVEFDLLPA